MTWVELGLHSVSQSWYMTFTKSVNWSENVLMPWVYVSPWKRVLPHTGSKVTILNGISIRVAATFFQMNQWQWFINVQETFLLVHFKKGHYFWSKYLFKLSPSKQYGVELLYMIVQNGQNLYVNIEIPQLSSFVGLFIFPIEMVVIR